MRTSVLAATLVLLWSAPVQAQFGGGGQPAPSTGWAPVSFGGRIGYDNTQKGEVVGGFVGIPVVRSGMLELTPSFDVTFLPGFEEYQTNFEVVYLSGEREGGVLAGAGIGFRNSPFSPDTDVERRTEVTFSAMIGVRIGTIGRFAPQVEARWILQDEWRRDPRQVSLGVGFSLWGR